MKLNALKSLIATAAVAFVATATMAQSPVSAGSRQSVIGVSQDNGTDQVMVGGEIKESREASSGGKRRRKGGER